jgi:HEAT repeat protein
VRLAAADALAQFRDLPSVRDGLVVSMERQSSPLVQVALIDLLVELQEQRATGLLRQLSENPASNPAVRQRAAWGLKLLL